MSPEQFERWRDFSLRMARTCFRTFRRPNARWIAGVVEDFFDGLDEPDIPCIVDWDNSTEYPQGNPRHCQCEEKSGIHHALYHRCSCAGDLMSIFSEDYRGNSPRCRACNDSGWGAFGRAECRCEDIDYRFCEQWDEQWGGPVCCCIRGGLDCASAPSAGVIGFTAGDIRRMYPKGVPDWVFPPDEQLKYWLRDELNGTFSELPDSAGVVL